MKNYLVGGAVRDQLLGLKVTEKDWVVVGATPEQMLSQGFTPVGKDFPVFIHPRSGEEYALARTERKAGHGYHGFTFNASPEVTLEEDLLRRDLTINAMAREPGGPLIDPHGGLRDLKGRWLRHVSEAFAEDPLRVLRVARFAARYHWLGFRVAEETLTLMRQLSDSGELAHLTAERVWKETEKGLMEQDPQIYFAVLEQCGALQVLLPELARLRGVPQPAAHHPEIDTLEHQYLALKQTALMGLPLTARFAVLVHDLGKGLTEPAEWPRHIAHEERSAGLAEQVATRLRAPNECRDIGVLVARFHTHCHRALELKAETVWKLFKALDAVRRPQRLELFLGACEADARGRLGFAERDYPQADYLRRAAEAVGNVDINAIRAQGFTGPQLGEAIDKARIHLLKELKQTWLTLSP
ncbi:multifunctional CCA addition/repair protein [Alcanivorax sp. 1008]|uniref:multifunctional CCA addition/repair protein n=1 Tax=Alcanivorax sp. 1008 TaxID=2816853 RepID=UPI001DF3D24B|nr:multifunctional CCA addition/repair protein [Alcanivorax sp. 1008]MCC1496645.1 multifunctional CCA addition/repair protein [Alcanivorax sp. 1008]